MKTLTFHIEGMTCNHCVMKVRKSLAQIEHLDVDDVRIGIAVVTYDEEAVQISAIDETITAAGYTVSGHE